MPDQVNPTEQIKEANQKANNHLEKAPDGQLVRNASKEQIDNALDQNQNRTRGMTELAFRDGFVDSPDKRSFELLVAIRDGKEETIDKNSPKAEAKIKTQKQAKHDQISQSAILMAIEAEKNPAMEAVALGRKHADSLPDDHPQKKPLTNLSRELAAEHSPKMKAHYEQYQGGTHKAIRPDQQPANTPEGWLTAAQKLSQLPMDKQLQVIGSGLMAGIEQYQHDERERNLGQLIGTVQGTGEVLQGLAKIADFGAACILGDNERAGKMGDEFGTALGQTIVGGVQLFQAADQYLYNIGYTGDYSKPFRDIQATGQKLDEHWSQLPPREQERIKTKLITEMIESGAIGAGGANAVQKASKFTEVLDALAVEAKQLHAAAKPAIKKAVKAINNAVDELVQPVGDTGMGVRMPIPKDPLKDENKMLMSKADDIGDERPRQPESGMKREPITEKFPPSKRFVTELEQVIEGLSAGERNFLKQKNILVKPVRRITDQFPNIRTQTAGCFDASESTIYLAEEVFSKGKWVPNNDLPFMARHEFGHAYNAKIDDFGDFLSNFKHFRAAFREDLQNVPPDVLDALQLSRKYRTPELARDEVFADMYAHTQGLQSNNSYSQLMKRWFPNSLKFVEEMPKW